MLRRRGPSVSGYVGKIKVEFNHALSRLVGIVETAVCAWRERVDW